jgi:hypothetical protein
MPDEPNNPEKKLIIDEDWKSQVEAEKEAARHAAEPEQPAAAQPSGSPQGPLPPANLSFLISTLYLQGMMGMGLVPNPITNKPSVELLRAKHAIDMLAMLQEKTQGNRTQDETEDLDAALHELRLTFVGVQ